MVARRTDLLITPDPSRVISRLFVAGHDDFGSRESRTSLIIGRIMQLTPSEVREAIDDVETRFGDRHDEFRFLLEAHAQRVANRIAPHLALDEDRWRLIGAFFSHECSIEGASITNPSAVAHVDQSGLPDGHTRFIMSVRCIGEGHRSSIGFRTGVIDEAGSVALDEPRARLTAGSHGNSQLEHMAFVGLLERMGDYGENARYVLEALGDTFSIGELDERLTSLVHDRDTYRHAEHTAEHFRAIAERNYRVHFPVDSHESERVLWPFAEAERRGMEDARFTRAEWVPGKPTFVGTYTAFDGTDISQQLIETDDFTSFDISPVSGPAAEGKGLAIFPRKIDGSYVAMSRADFETNSIAFSHHLEYWEKSEILQRPTRSWELIQLGNSGAPIETEAGWLVLTHAVGPMRTYTLGAMLLDLRDPMRIISVLDEPLLSPLQNEREGYVPNVVYSCGSMRAGNNLMIPFGIADQSIGVAVARIDDLLERLT
ncbi:MAG: hypothetical protein RIQ64_1996 [Actinomycetota bacterium]